MPTVPRLCDPDSLHALVAAVSDDDNDAAVARLTEALARWPEDPRLHFLLASCLAESRRYDAAVSGFEAAIALQPEFAIARFQLGLLHLTSGRAAVALGVWADLDRLEERDALRLFKRGLAALIEDRAAECIELLQQGVAVNQAYPPLNRDMQLVIERARAALAGTTAESSLPSAAQATGSGHVLLAEYLSSKTKH